ncbi:MAG: hypothetical protein MJE68_05980 [Proteobacteria bacterium]|nr:hypothetical protein [Pseudomonadota bacterium]
MGAAKVAGASDLVGDLLAGRMGRSADLGKVPSVTVIRGEKGGKRERCVYV